VLVLRELANRDQRVVQANETGAFLVEDLPAASYSLHASALGYVGRQYGQRHTLEEGVPIIRRPGEARREIDVALLPGSVITGRVTTRGGQPLAFAEVEAIRPQLESQLRVLLPIGRAESNERGAFRIVGLPPATTTSPRSTRRTKGPRTSAARYAGRRPSTPASRPPPRPNGSTWHPARH
jgi:hypothetical protein